MPKLRQKKQDKKATRFTKFPTKIENQVFDYSTLLTLNKLITSEYLTEVKGPISVGKEANVFLGYLNEEPRAVKIYRVETTSFNNMLPYMVGDPRFQVKKDKRQFIYTWAKKEFRNLKRAYKANVSVPRPYIVMKNVVVMECIGGETPALRLKNTTVEDPLAIYEQVVENMKKLYKEGIVHSDLSEFNILINNGKAIFIDMGQSVVLEHPNSREFLERDAANMSRFFSKIGVKTSKKEVLNRITSPSQ